MQNGGVPCSGIRNYSAAPLFPDEAEKGKATARLDGKQPFSLSATSPCLQRYDILDKKSGEKPYLCKRNRTGKTYPTMQKIHFELREGEEFIPLIQLLKAASVVENGSQAQAAVEAGIVYRNGNIEYRKRAKIRKGENIRIGDCTIFVG